jgi:uncharacterized protein YjbI with pentapeptide repeats
LTIRGTNAANLAYARRWAGKEFALEGPSPFGNTETGAKDYRGVSFAQRTISNLEINDADFSASDLRHLRVDGCAFRNCSFERAILTELVTRASRFDECRFGKADLSVFNGAKLARVGFLNAVFTNVSFDGKDWSHTDFRASGFWNCSFSGVLKDIIFRGSYLFPYQMEISGEPRRTGLHNVDFTKADFHWVGAYTASTSE